MGTASRLTIEENMAIALRRGQKRGLGWGVKEKDRIQFQEALKELNIGLENRLKSRYSIPLRRTKTGLDPSHGSSGET